MDDKDIIICRCEETTLGDIIEAIEDGASTVAAVKKRTRAGMGLCQGKSCSRLIERLIAKHTGVELKDVYPTTFRPPVRPIKMSVIEGDKNEKV